MNFLILIVLLIILAGLQAVLPTLWWLGGLRLELLPATVAFVALTQNRSRAIALAVIAGLLQDSLSAAPFGLSALAYGTIALVLSGMQEVLDRDLPWVFIGAGAVVSGTASLAALCVVGFSFGSLTKLLILALIAGVLTPVISLLTNHCLLKPSR